jgi:hypothetical protein
MPPSYAVHMTPPRAFVGDKCLKAVAGVAVRKHSIGETSKRFLLNFLGFPRKLRQKFGL